MSDPEVKRQFEEAARLWLQLAEQIERLRWKVSARSERYRVRAAECQEHAKEVSDPEVKRQFEEAARLWLQLAEQIERLRW